MNEQQPRQNWLMRVYGRWQIRRLRRAYTGVSGWHSPLEGYDGFVQELQWGLENLSPERREQADNAVLTAVLFGKFFVRLIRGVATWFPNLVARLFDFFTPTYFGFLIGPATRVGSVGLEIPVCRFESAGGRPLCLQVCRARTQVFFDRMRVPLAMTPDMQSHSCHWRYGAPKGSHDQ